MTTFDPLDDRPPRNPVDDTNDALARLTKVVERMDSPVTPEDVADIRRSLDQILFQCARTADTLASLRTYAFIGLLIGFAIFIKV